MSKQTNIIAITYGEPAGIGPDLALQIPRYVSNENNKFVIIGDKNILQARAKTLGLSYSFNDYTKDSFLQDSTNSNQHSINILHIPSISPCKAGQLNINNSPHVLDCLNAGIEGCLNNTFSALVTCPIHKGIINESGIPFTGHTEYLAEKSQVEKVVMMLCENNSNFNLRVALVTTHLALKDISKAITNKAIESTLRILKHDLEQYFKIKSPNIFVCGLNPHAGEDGHLGDEEINVIEPCLKQLRKEGFKLTGPLPADTLFIPDNLLQADAVVAMYHDQGLPMLKHLGFGQAINVTLGLPFIRTSVDHGTALHLAGTGKAKSDSLFNAIALAEKLSKPKSSVSSTQNAIT